jgi:hypothetical protein
MIEYEFLKQGLFGMANAHKASSMAGHLGAAVVTGYFIGENLPKLPKKVFDGIRRDLNRIMGGEESIWFDEKKTGITAGELFANVPATIDDWSSIQRIANALSGNIAQTRQSGHNVIFASIALRGLSGHPDLATTSVINGITRLIKSFDKAHAGRGYYGKAIGWKTGNKAPTAPESSIKPYPSMLVLAETVVNEVIAEAHRHRRGFGGLFHLINHAAALIELDRMGLSELARKGLPAHRQHLLLFRALPVLDEELGKLKSTDQNPLEGEYWMKTKSEQWGAWLTHRIKTIYGFQTLLGHIEDQATRDRATKQFRYLMA